MSEATALGSNSALTGLADVAGSLYLGSGASVSTTGGTTFNFVENSGGTGGTLSLRDGSLTANIQMTGVYSNKSFTLAPDSGTGTLVKFA